MKENPLPPLKVLDFEVHAVYGAHFDVSSDSERKQKWIDWFERHKKLKRAPFREGWTPIYRDHCSTITLDINTPEWCNNLDVVHPKLFCKGAQGANESQSSPVKMEVSRCLTVRKDGAAAVTIRLKADKRENPYDMADILAPLLLAPRIISGIKLHSDNVNVLPSDEMATILSEVYKPTEDADPESQQALIDELAVDDSNHKSKSSPLFKLFLGALKEIVSQEPCPRWGEYHSASMPVSARKNFEKERYLSTELLPWVGDQQIPYFVVFATLPEADYTEAFLETGAETELIEAQQKKRQKYTRMLAAILLRWLSPHNANYISIDFLQSLGVLKDGVFINQYMNSLSFVTYSSTGSLCLRPDRQGSRRHQELDPQEATYGSILRCVELSRLRWHHAHRLNLLLDNLIEQVIDHDGLNRFEDYLAQLLALRAEAALHFLDPLTYQWDATVGADIASFLQIDVIERIEKECVQKLDMVKELIHEKLDVLRARAMHG